MFGFNMTKDEAKLSSTQDNHYEYIVSGQFMRDLTKSEADLADIAWFTRHKETIKKAFITKGANAEKANFLKELRNVELPGNNRKVVVDNSGDFDARRFTAD